MAILFCGGSAVHAQALQLELLTDLEPVVGFSESAPIQVRFSGVDRPIEGAAVSFTPLTDPADTYLSVMRDITDADGLAGTMIMAGVEPIDFDVQISVSGLEYDGVEPLTVHVRVAASAGLLEVEYPGDFSSMQEAIDVLADGGTLRIAAGIHEMEPTFIRGKTVHIRGSGPNCWIPGRRGRWSFGTVLVSPEVDRVTAPEEAQGSLHFIEADGSVSNLRITGGDAGIATRGTGRQPGRPLSISNTCITNTVRGIHHKSTTPLSVSNTVIRGTAWNGISVSPPEPVLGDTITFQAVIVFASQAFCMYFENTAATVSDDQLANCAHGGIAARQSAITVLDTLIVNVKKAGILLEDSYGYIANNIILGTDEWPVPGTNPQEYVFGDAILVSLGSTAYIIDNYTMNSMRAAIANFGSFAALSDNRLSCQSMDLNGEPLGDDDFIFDDLGGNLCGCPFANGNCGVTSSSVAPPPPVGGLE
jgi:hypothetical protein